MQDAPLSPEQSERLQKLIANSMSAYEHAEDSGFQLLPILQSLQAVKDGKDIQKELAKQQYFDSTGLFAPGHIPKEAASAFELLEHMQKEAKRSKLGEIPRSEMPQVQAWQAKDDGVPMGKLEFVDPDDLKYTQEKINETKAQGIANHWDTVGKEPVLISKDNWVLDGHHRVAAARKKSKWVRCYRVALPGRTALERLKGVPQIEDPA